MLKLSIFISKTRCVIEKMSIFFPCFILFRFYECRKILPLIFLFCTHTGLATTEKTGCGSSVNEHFFGIHNIFAILSVQYRRGGWWRRWMFLVGCCFKVIKSKDQGGFSLEFRPNKTKNIITMKGNKRYLKHFRRRHRPFIPISLRFGQSTPTFINIFRSFRSSWKRLNKTLLREKFLLLFRCWNLVEVFFSSLDFFLFFFFCLLLLAFPNYSMLSACLVCGLSEAIKYSFSTLLSVEFVLSFFKWHN